MGKLYDGLDQRWRDWIAAQHLFFVSTAPSVGGHVNGSPKGIDSFRVLGEREVAYLDLVGSGAETIAHVRENGRVTVMFCAFEGPPMILRLYGRGEVCEPGQSEWKALAEHFPDYPNVRSIIRIQVDRIQDSCGYGIPLMEYREERTQMDAWAQKKGADGLREYQLENNLESVDGLPALRGESLR